MNESLNQHTGANHSEQSQAQIHAIRNILFGQNMAEYESKFQKLQAAMSQQREELEEQIAANDGATMQAIAQLQERLTDQMKQNQAALLEEIRRLGEQKLDRRQLGLMLIEIGNQIST